MLESTILDVYLLPETYVTLQSVPWKGSNIPRKGSNVPRKRSNVIQWLASSRKKQHLLGNNVKQNKIAIGPMDEQLNHLVVHYIYKYNEDDKNAFHRSSAAILHLIG